MGGGVLYVAVAFCTLLVIEESEGFEPRGAQGSRGACFTTAGTLIPSVALFLSGSVTLVLTWKSCHRNTTPPPHPLRPSAPHARLASSPSLSRTFAALPVPPSPSGRLC